MEKFLLTLASSIRASHSSSDARPSATNLSFPRRSLLVIVTSTPCSFSVFSTFFRSFELTFTLCWSIFFRRREASMWFISSWLGVLSNTLRRTHLWISGSEKGFTPTGSLDLYVTIRPHFGRIMICGRKKHNEVIIRLKKMFIGIPNGENQHAKERMLHFCKVWNITLNLDDISCFFQLSHFPTVLPVIYFDPIQVKVMFIILFLDMVFQNGSLLAMTFWGSLSLILIGQLLYSSYTFLHLYVINVISCMRCHKNNLLLNPSLIEASTCDFTIENHSNTLTC